MMKQKPLIYVAGHHGMVGSAIIRELMKTGQTNIIVRSHNELDLTNQLSVSNFFKSNKPDQVYIAAAKVGGIHANSTYPAEFIYDNLMVQTNIVHEAWSAGVRKLLFLGSSCIYPKAVKQPMREDALLSGILEPSNEPYAIAKIAGIKICESYNRQYKVDYRSVMPTNLYGPGDNYHLDNSHVIPALIRRFHEAKINRLPQVVIWGSGLPMREFMYVDDMASACVYVMNLEKSIYDAHTRPMLSHINVGNGSDITISNLAMLISEVVGYKGGVSFDPTKLDGIPKKLMDSSCLNSLGWKAKVNLKDGLARAYNDYVINNKSLRK